MLNQNQKECLKEFCRYKCEICKKRESDLNRLIIHHINRQSKEINDSLRNLQVICENCHKLMHFKEFS